MIDYKIAIPSYKRAETIKNKTLTLMSQYNIDPERVTIFVANEQEYDTYHKNLSDTAFRNIVIGEVGMGAIRRFMQSYYPEGTYLMQFDDDLQQILRKVDDKKFEPIENLEEELIFKGFRACEANNAYLFGIYAAANPMFMKHKISVGLYYCIGSCWGVINRHDNSLSVTLDDKEDYERTLQHYVKDGNVVRLDNITVKSKYYTEEGGMQVERTSERILRSAENLVQRFPGLCTMYIRETTGHAELRLRDSVGISGGSNLESFFS
jgi:hypothetical protein